MASPSNCYFVHLNCVHQGRTTCGASESIKKIFDMCYSYCVWADKKSNVIKGRKLWDEQTILRSK